MADAILSDYFYGDESEQFVFFRIPRQLITDPRFRQVSNDAKLLYGMLLDRMSLSSKRGWYDANGRVYIYYTVEEICGNLLCGKDKAMRLLAELDSAKGIGLIQRVRQGQGRPTRIYVKRFATQALPPVPEAEKHDLQKSENPTSRDRENRLAEVGKPDPSYTERNQTKPIHPYPSTLSQPDAMERWEARKEIAEAIDFQALQKERPFEDVESLLELMTDVLCGTSPTVRIGGDRLPAEAVKRRFRRLEGDHIRYVLDALGQTDKKIVNIRAYLLTALYNAPVTMGPFYSAVVRHDLHKKQISSSVC